MQYPPPPTPPTPADSPAPSDAALLDSTALLRGAFAAMSEGLVLQRADGSIIDANPAAESILGLTRDQLLGRSSLDPRWHAVREDGSPVPGSEHPAMVALRSNRPVRDQIMGVQAPSFGLRWLSINAVPIAAPGTAAGPASRGNAGAYAVVATFVDITERRLLAQRLADGTQALNDLYDNAPCGYHSLNANGVVVRINNTALAWLGRTRESVLGRCHMTDFLTPVGQALFNSQFPRLKATGRVDALEVDLVCRNGPPRRVSVSASAVYSAQGDMVATRTVMHDITELSLMREHLQAVVQQQDAMLDNDLVGIMRLHQHRAVWHNQALGRMFGYPGDALLGRSSRLLFLDDASWHAASQAVAQALRDGKPFRQQLPMRRQDGSCIWVDVRGIALALGQDETLWLMTDITAQKQAEAAGTADWRAGPPVVPMP